MASGRPRVSAINAFSHTISAAVSVLDGGGTTRSSLPLFSAHVLQEPAVGSTCPQSGSTPQQHTTIQPPRLGIPIFPFQILGATQTDKAVLAGAPGMKMARGYGAFDLPRRHPNAGRCLANRYDLGANTTASAQQQRGGRPPRAISIVLV